MKNGCLSLLLLGILITSTYAQKTYVPDDNFEGFLINQEWDDVKDDSVLTANISGRALLDVRNLINKISDLTGIEDFKALQILHCENNSLTSLNLTGLTLLRELHCYNNLLTSLTINQNSALTLLVCYNNKLTGMDVSQNTKMASLSCNDNDIVQLNVSGATALITLSCSRNEIVLLDLNNNTALKAIDCSYNNLIILKVSNGKNDLITNFNATNNVSLTCIEVDDAAKANSGAAPYTFWNKPTTATYSENCIAPETYVPDEKFELALQELGYDAGAPDQKVYTHEIARVYSLPVSGKGITDLTGIEDFENLEILNCSNNQIDTLDLSSNTSLVTVECNNNQLASLNVRNGYNSLITTFSATGNPALTCIEVDDEIKANGGLAPYANWQKDPTAGYCANCSLFGVTISVPDDWFEGALIAKGLDHGVPDDSVNASVVSRVISLDVNSKNIHDLTGIEGFTALEILKCANDSLHSLDVSQNSFLRVLECYHNQFTTLDLSHNAALLSLNCANNLLEGLDVSYNHALGYLNCQGNNIRTLDLSNNPDLSGLSCQANLLENMDLSHNTLLKELSCYNNQLSELDLSLNTSLTHLYCENNQLTDLDVSGGAMVLLDCSKNQLTSLVVSDNSNLERLECRYNQITALDLGDISKIWLLDCSNNRLTNIDVDKLTKLVDFVCSNNQLTELDVTNNTLLGGLYCGNRLPAEFLNQIESLITVNNPNLLTLHCNNNKIASLDLSNNLNLRSLMCSSNRLPMLNLCLNTRLTEIIAYDNPLLEEVILPGESCGKAGEASLTGISAFAATASNTTLKALNMSETALKSINVLNFAVLDSLHVRGTKLDSLNVSGNLVLRYLNITSTPLKCVQVNQNQLNSIPAGWIKDATTTYSVNCKSSTPIDDEILAESILIYPNPGGDILTIESGIPLQKVEFYSVTGKKIMVIQSGFEAIPVKGLSEGVYMLKIDTEFGSTMIKFLKK